MSAPNDPDRKATTYAIVGLFVLGFMFGPLAILNANRAKALNHTATVGKVLGWCVTIQSFLTLRMSAAPAFADVVRGQLRLLLSGPSSSAGRPMPEGTAPTPGGWNLIHLIVGDISAEVEQLRAAGVTFRNDIVTGPGGQQILLEDPSGNVVGLFEPADKYTSHRPGANLSKLRELAKRLKTQQELALELWETSDTAARPAGDADLPPESVRA